MSRRATLAGALALLAAVAALEEQAIAAHPHGLAARWRAIESRLRPKPSVPDVRGPVSFRDAQLEPVVDGSRFPTREFHVPIFRRPPDLLPPAGTPAGSGFPNGGQSLRRDAGGKLVPYWDRAEIEDGALDGQHLEICWIRDPTDAV